MKKVFMLALVLCSLLLTNREADAANGRQVCAPAIQQNRMAVRCVAGGSVVSERLVTTLSFSLPTWRRWHLVDDPEIKRVAGEVAFLKDQCEAPGRLRSCRTPGLSLLEMRLDWAVAEYAKNRGFRIAERVSW